jgi:3',5'-cyclic AMP phosphodiesterase CpdA
MTLLAHLSDFHLLEDTHHRRRGVQELRLKYLSYFRPLDVADRKRRAGQALAAARAADHIVLTGDLTEDGTEAQYECLAALLHEARIDPEQITLVPGNHDGYLDTGSFGRALDGPLRPWSKGSHRGAVTTIPGVLVVPLSTVIAQPFVRSAGAVGERELQRVHDVTGKHPDRAVVIAQHHPPFPYALRARQWMDGLQDHVRSVALLATHRNLHVLHGHLHRSVNRRVAGESRPRAFSPAAVVDGLVPLRLYEVADRELHPLPPRSVEPRTVEPRSV